MPRWKHVKESRHFLSKQNWNRKSARERDGRRRPHLAKTIPLIFSSEEHTEATRTADRRWRDHIQNTSCLSSYVTTADAPIYDEETGAHQRNDNISRTHIHTRAVVPVFGGAPCFVASGNGCTAVVPFWTADLRCTHKSSLTTRVRMTYHTIYRKWYRTGRGVQQDDTTAQQSRSRAIWRCPRATAAAER